MDKKLKAEYTYIRKLNRFAGASWIPTYTEWLENRLNRCRSESKELQSQATNNASPKLVEDLESARDWLLPGKRKVNSTDIKFCLEELNNIINQLQA